MKLFKIFLFSLLPYLINAQFLTNEHFAAYGTITSVGTSSPFTFTITGFIGNNRPYQRDAYFAADALVGDKIFIACDQYVISSITSTAPNFSGTLTKIDVNTPDPTNFQKVAVIREYVAANGLITYALPAIGDGNAASIGGIDIALGACIKAHYMARDSATLNTAFADTKEITRYTGNGVPSFTPLLGEPVKAIGLLAPFPEYNWNGTTWISQSPLIFYGSFKNPKAAELVTPIGGLWDALIDNEMGAVEGQVFRRKN